MYANGKGINSSPRQHFQIYRTPVSKADSLQPVSDRIPIIFPQQTNFVLSFLCTFWSIVLASLNLVIVWSNPMRDTLRMQLYMPLTSTTWGFLLCTRTERNVPFLVDQRAATFFIAVSSVERIAFLLDH
jgi:hypothetical protein